MLSIAFLDGDSCVELHQAGWWLSVIGQTERTVSSPGKPEIPECSTGNSSLFRLLLWALETLAHFPWTPPEAGSRRVSKKGGQKGGSTLLAGRFEAAQGRIQDSPGWKGQRAARMTMEVSGQDLNLTLVEEKQRF